MGLVPQGATLKALAFTVMGRPIAWARPQGHGGGTVARRRTKHGWREPASAQHLKRLRKAFADAALQQRCRQFTGPTVLCVHFHFAGSRRDAGFTAIELRDFTTWADIRRSQLWPSSSLAEGLEPCTDLVDMDNLEKLVLEAAQHSGVLANDCLVVHVEKRKTGSTKKQPRPTPSRVARGEVGHVHQPPTED